MVLHTDQQQLQMQHMAVAGSLQAQRCGEVAAPLAAAAAEGLVGAC
jgi:hypothetical protein